MKTTTIFEALKSEKLAKILKNDQRTTKHKMTIMFNAGDAAAGDFDAKGKGSGWGFNTAKRPTAMDENNIKIKGNILGP
jgi:hypothetical protein